ncbi:hypothetical protein HYH03_015496 [Edaphochlamys debaryana]|uniref:Purple acid phosphatase n=1 Tax=Edaphochlamys debaryana TaxID=47281 RepID=A0A836BR44_9CHLO|nr:hypothetical protein HYH03_015496 [Edaphochlamys debaryana]|eukprot:KAG2485785.1 hypothetical protein HYH03_015496 [Edaphochlamys debaryana]
MAKLTLAVIAAAVLLCSVAAQFPVGTDDDAWLLPDYRRNLIAEAGAAAFQHTSVPCDPDVVGSVAACFNQAIPAIGNIDYKFGAPEVAYPSDGAPWGVHLTGPYPDGRSYLVSWYTGAPTVGSDLTQPDTSSLMAYAAVKADALSTSSAMMGRRMPPPRGHRPPAMWTSRTFTGSVITYLRQYIDANANASYLSPHINHVVLKDLAPSTSYTYQLSDASGKLVGSYKFKTLPLSKDVYPLRVGLIADIGQTVNSSDTRDHLMANMPQVVIMVGDNTYADNYGAQSPDLKNGKGTNQQRWDTYSQLWQPLYSTVPILNCAANHELEMSGIAAVINYTTTSFSFPSNYPFQSYSARFPVPGTTKNFGDITSNLYYSTVIAGRIKLITLNNYVPFHPGTPQYMWAMKEFAAVDRTQTPWLFVQFHAPPYHTYFVHYKEMECFMSIWEDVFYQYGVDLVLNGHVHAYERTHPMYKYKLDNCGPIYITIGDGGNVEGPYRNFVDDVNPATNKTYCEALNYGGLNAVQMLANNTSGWGPSYQLQAHPPNCTTLSFQPASGVSGGAPLVMPPGMMPPAGFCQSSQPVWSAYRDPSFGHGILDLLSDTTARFRWFKNLEGNKVAMDDVTLERLSVCPNRPGAQMPGSRRMRSSA